MTALEKEIPMVPAEAVGRKSELLRRLRTEPSVLASERRSFPAGAGPRLAALLRDIDETVLPRVLRLNDGPREVARLTVSHRRLISVEVPGRLATVSHDLGLPDLLAARLIDLVETRAGLSLTITRRQTVPKHAEPACSVASLRLALTGATPQAAFDRQLHHATARSQAQVVWSDQIPQIQVSGAEDWAEPLMTLVEHYRNSGRGNRAAPRMSPVRTQGVAIPVDDALVVVIASLETRGFAVVLPRKAGLDLIEAWPFY